MIGIDGVITQISAFVPYTPALPFLGAFIGGEETIILIAIFAAATGALSFQVVLIAAILGTIISDLCWFLVGTYALARLEHRPRIQKGLAMVANFVTRISGDRLFVALLITKFLYGTRIVMLLYLAKRELSIARFIVYDAAVTSVWAVVICLVGWYAGKGISILATIFGDITIGLGVIVLLLFIFYAIRVWFNKVIIQEEIQS